MTPAEAKQIMDQVKTSLGADFRKALEAETPSRLGTDAQTEATRDAATEDLFTALWDDVQDIPRSHGMIARSALSLALPMWPIDLPLRLIADSHFHPTSYSGKINSLARLIAYMDHSSVERSNLAGIPSQVYKPTDQSKYYANSKDKMDYRDHDFALAVQWEELSDEQQKRFDLNITGIDVTNGPNIAQELDNRLRAHPRVFNGVGEVTGIKEIVTEKNPHRPDVAGGATQTLLIESAKRGLPVILHHDRGVPGQKNKYAEKVRTAVREWATRMTTFATEQDPLKLRPGVDPATVPKIKPKLVWAHGAGISRFTAESNHHTRDLDELLSEPDLADILYLDLSWDYITNDMMENVYDQLTRHNVAPRLREGLQNALKLYKAFTYLGGLADKADDLRNKNLSSTYRLAGEAIAKHYYAALADFRERVREAFDDPHTLTVFTNLMNEHGTDGNNWLYLMRAHSDRLMFGTDALAVGIKAHGDSAYAMNVLVMYPLFEILEGAARTIPTAAGISQKIARTNYDTVFHDPEIIARRHAWEDYLATEKSAESSSQLRSAAGLEQRLRQMNFQVERYRHLETSRTHRTEGGEWTQERAELHRQIVDEVYARHAQVPAQRQAVMTGGLPGAGRAA